MISEADGPPLSALSRRLPQVLAPHLTKPRALGMTITVFNLEVLDLPGDDAAVLKAATMLDKRGMRIS